MMSNINNYGANMKGKITAFIASTMLAIPGGILPANAQAGLNLGGVNIDAVGLAKEIINVTNASKNRAACVKNLMFATNNFVRGRANVMVFNLNQDFDANLPGAFYTSANCNDLTYGIWIFKSGEFTNKGDGGWINWAFSGNFKRDGYQGHHVTFSQL